MVMDRDMIRFSFRFMVRDCFLVTFTVWASLVLRLGLVLRVRAVLKLVFVSVHECLDMHELVWLTQSVSYSGITAY